MISSRLTLWDCAPASAPSPQPMTHAPSVRVQSMSRLAQGGRWRTEAMRSYAAPMLYWFTRGQGRITISGQTRGYGPHTVVFLPPNTMHGFEIGAQCLGTAITLPSEAGLPWPEHSLHLRLSDSRRQMELTGLIDAMEREQQSKDNSKEFALAHYAGLIAVWIARLAESTEAPQITKDKAHALVAKFTALIERDFRSGDGIQNYADALGVTPTHLTRVCQIASGRPASAILADRRLFEARRLLSDTAIPVSQISDQLGFSSPAYFSRMFSRHCGKSPTAFRSAA